MPVDRMRALSGALMAATSLESASRAAAAVDAVPVGCHGSLLAGKPRSFQSGKENAVSRGTKGKKPWE